jgi:hypothetical protein
VELAAVLVVLLLLGLVLYQAWMLWYVRREVRRLDQRLDESLDAEDLVEFREQMDGLLEQVKESGLDLAQSLEIRHAAVGKAVEKAREAEQKLGVRLQAMEKVAEKMAQRLAAAEAAVPVQPKKGVPKAKPEAALRSEAPATRPEPPLAPAPPPPAPVSPAPSPLPRAEAAAEAGARARSYLIRPAVQPRHQRVYELADQGWSREQIAKEAGLLPGEVDLILNLRHQRPSQG